jgi:hypothetical protein
LPDPLPPPPPPPPLLQALEEASEAAKAILSGVSRRQAAIMTAVQAASARGAAALALERARAEGSESIVRLSEGTAEKQRGDFAAELRAAKSEARSRLLCILQETTKRMGAIKRSAQSARADCAAMREALAQELPALQQQLLRAVAAQQAAAAGRAAQLSAESSQHAAAHRAAEACCAAALQAAALQRQQAEQGAQAAQAAQAAADQQACSLQGAQAALAELRAQLQSSQRLQRCSSAAAAAASGAKASALQLLAAAWRQARGLRLLLQGQAQQAAAEASAAALGSEAGGAEARSEARRAAIRCTALLKRRREEAQPAPFAPLLLLRLPQRGWAGAAAQAAELAAQRLREARARAQSSARHTALLLAQQAPVALRQGVVEEACSAAAAGSAGSQRR